MSTILGTAENGALVDIDFPFYRGRAGVRQVGEVLQAAYLGARRPRITEPVDGLVDGRPCKATDASDSKDTTGMVRLTIVPIDAAA